MLLMGWSVKNCALPDFSQPSIMMVGCAIGGGRHRQGQATGPPAAHWLASGNQHDDWRVSGRGSTSQADTMMVGDTFRAARQNTEIPTSGFSGFSGFSVFSVFTAQGAPLGRGGRGPGPGEAGGGRGRPGEAGGGRGRPGEAGRPGGRGAGGGGRREAGGGRREAGGGG